MASHKRSQLEFNTEPLIRFYKKYIDALLWVFFGYGKQILLIFVAFLFGLGKLSKYLFKKAVPSIVYWRRNLTKLLRLIYSAVVQPFVLLGRCFLFLARSVREAKGAGKLAAPFVAPARSFRQNPRPLITFLNHSVPIIAAVALIALVTTTAFATYAVEIDFDGNSIGIVKNEQAYQTANAMFLGRVVETGETINTSPSFKLVRASAAELLTTKELTDKLIKNTNIEIAEGFGLYVDGTFVRATEQKSTIEEELAQILQKYKTDDESEKVGFVASVEPVGGLYPKSAIISAAAMRALINPEHEGVKTYTAQKGDTPESIASEQGLELSELLAANPGLLSTTTLYAGNKLSLGDELPFLNVKTTRRLTYNQSVQYKINETKDGSLIKGTVKVTQTGIAGQNQITADADYINGEEIGRKIIEVQTLSAPRDENRIVGTLPPETAAQRALSNAAPSTQKGTFIWPATGGYVSQGWRGSRHPALDIAGVGLGSTTYASASGTVILAKRNGNYGNEVIIDHGNGYQTLYAHHTMLYVSAGQKVYQGQPLGGAGQTGRATGIHLHFELRYNGTQLNPASFVGTR